MYKVSLSLTASLVIVSGIVGLAGGYYISPSYQQTMYAKETMGLGQADRFLDLRYLNKMATHHQGAMLLAEQVQQQSTRTEIRDLAGAILEGEPKLIAELNQWKKDWYNDSREAPKPLVAKLGQTDEKLDLRFLNALIAHHQDGIEMTKEARQKSSRKEILDNADAVENFLSGSIVTLKNWREQWYGVK